jgi:hypothetical protein
MLTLRRLLLAALLMGLVIGCKAKSQPPAAGETPAEHTAKKIEEQRKAQEDPKLLP